MEQVSDSRLEVILKDSATPRWLKELNQFLPVKSQFQLHGNIRDQHPLLLNDTAPSAEDPPHYGLFTTQQLIIEFLALKGFKHFFEVNPLSGVSILTPALGEFDAKNTLEWLAKNPPLTTRPNMNAPIRFETSSRAGQYSAATERFVDSVEFVEKIVHNSDAQCAVLFDYLMGQTEQGQTGEKDAFIRTLILSYQAKELPTTARFNTVFWLCDRENDLPPWFALNNPRMRSIGIPAPDSRTRALVGGSLLADDEQLNFAALDADQRKRVVDDFSSQTDGLLMGDIAAIMRFIPSQGLKVTEVAEAARRYKLGVTEDPWRRIGEDKDLLRKAEARIRGRVKGQEHAITKSLDIIQRAIVGLAGAQAGRTSGKPKGVLFLAGPTGVGKTELAKAITESLFGDENAYIRFDMSEFNHEHSDQRLIGAPPGYLGFEAGGELTKAIRERPFSVVLFDEIEKAHSKIMDKFLQILDDGQLTSGKGERVYFSDAVIVFTSNLGMQKALPTDSLEDLERKLRDGITDHFVSKLGRPEILNRIGDNIVVFDYIRSSIAIQILSKMVQSVIDRVRETHQITLSISGYPAESTPEPGTAFAALASHCTTDLKNGGRGIGNILETALVNPLGRALWGIEARNRATILIRNIRFEGGRALLDLE